MTYDWTLRKPRAFTPSNPTSSPIYSRKRRYVDFHPMAQSNLGVCYHKGRGIAQDIPYGDFPLFVNP